MFEWYCCTFGTENKNVGGYFYLKEEKV